MDKIEKFLRKLNLKENIVIERVLIDLRNNNLSTYDIKKLIGYNDIFRIRVGTIRIIFKKIDNKIDILDIGRRSEKTHKEY